MGYFLIGLKSSGLSMIENISVYPVAGRGLASNSIQVEIEFLTSIRSVFSVEIYPGTFNVYSKIPIDLDIKDCLNYKLVSIGLMPRFIWAATLNGRRCYLMRWVNCPLHIFEIIADYNISQVENPSCCYHLNIDSNSKPIGSLKFLYWHLVWFERYDWWYKKRMYWLFFRLIRLRGISGQY
jgi:hypothetical protein